MMGIESTSASGRLSRARTTLDTSILRSKTGHAILKGGKFYSQCLGKKLLQLSNDARVEIRIINYRRKLLLDKQSRRMKRSEQLVKTYNLPPLKSSGTKQSKPTPDSGNGKETAGMNNNVQSVNRQKQTSDPKTQRGSEPRLNRAKTPTKLEISGRNYHGRDKTPSPSPADDIRRAICSPVPSNHEDEERGELADGSTQLRELRINPAYPHITVEKCEELLPPVQRAPSPSTPEYTLNKLESRSGSSNSLEVPSPIMQRRSLDGKMVTIVSPGNMFSNFSQSEGSIPDALKNQSCTSDPRFMALEAVLRPTTITKAQTRSPAKIDIEFKTGSLPRTPSPRRQPGRLLRREDERQHWRSLNTKTPP